MRTVSPPYGTVFLPLPPLYSPPLLPPLLAVEVAAWLKLRSMANAAINVALIILKFTVEQEDKLDHFKLIFHVTFPIPFWATNAF
jgi:hypothetical protein